MYNAVVHKIQRLEMSFSDEDYEDWKKQNPHSKHTHENYVIDTAVNADDESFWQTVELDLICIVYSKDN